MEESLLIALALCAFPTLACLLAQLLFPSFIMNDDAVIRTSIREIVLYRQLPGGRRVLTRVVGWRYSIHVRRSPAFKRRRRAHKQQQPARGNKRRPLLLRLLKRLRQRYQPKDGMCLRSAPQDQSSPFNHTTQTTHHDHPAAP